ncbi:transmembrane protein 119b [Periophthalmus magnuspinnatus]|uniref:transmembrane protein 119b n=1 Tax=Periophthalmus magnuspinnatus TaxID=409849 RepID=UPI00145A138F|nr:transmembrane protein 119b [Periophthalmus magnuspinnatus]
MKSCVFRLLVVVFSSTLAHPLALYSTFEGSTDEDELLNFTSSLAPMTLTSELLTTPLAPERLTTPLTPELLTTAAGSSVSADALKRVEDFLRDNTLLILITITLVFLMFLVLCGAFFMSRKRRFNAYYPSSFPSKMYVDHRDKTGGAKPFSDLPEKVSLEQNETVDSHRQLQADIMRAARSLRTPPKAEGQEHRSEEIHTRDSILDSLLPSLPEESEPCQLSLSEAAVSEESLSQRDSQETLINRSERPTSLHVHDAATLQLIAGEKTAF